jgi:hypothetical protein
MKFLQILVLTFGLAIFVNAQSSEKAGLFGNVYDANGSLIVGARITAINERGEKFEAVTNEDGNYTLNLPFNRYSPNLRNFKVAKYEITVVKENGFEKFVLKDFKFVPSYKGKMNLDFALDILATVDTIPVDTANKNKTIKRKNNKQ